MISIHTTVSAHKGLASAFTRPPISPCSRLSLRPRACVHFSADSSGSVSRRRIIAAPPAVVMAASSDEQKDPKDFKYIQLWTSQDGETHIKECKMTGFDLKTYSSLPQFVKSEFGGEPTKITFTELAVGLKQPLHTAPEVQFVVTLSGSWYIETTDGSRHVFKPGEVLFQDNTKENPAAKAPQHYSGTVGDEPCRQFIVQFNRPPEVDNPEPF